MFTTVTVLFFFLQWHDNVFSIKLNVACFCSPKGPGSPRGPCGPGGPGKPFPGAPGGPAGPESPGGPTSPLFQTKQHQLLYVVQIIFNKTSHVLFLTLPLRP